MFKKRIGNDPHELFGPRTPNIDGCPDIWELESGDFAVIGLTKTSLLKSSLPNGAGCGPDEAIVVIPRRTLIAAKQDIPAS